MISFGRVPVLALAFFCSSVGPWHHVVGVAAVQAIWKEMENWLLQCCNSFLIFRFSESGNKRWNNGMVLFPRKHPSRSHEKFSQNIIISHTVLAGLSKFFENGGGSRQHCRLTICNELVELTNSETAAATPLGGGAKSLRSLSSLETGSVWSFLVN